MEVSRTDSIANDSLQLILIYVTCDSNGVCVDSKSIMETTLTNISANMTIWVVGLSISDEHNIDAICRWIDATCRGEHEVTHTLCCTTCVCQPTTIIN